MDFNKAKQQLDSELNAYTSIYDNLVGTKAVSDTAVWTTRKTDFDA